jgi:hypothetical protein
MGIGISVFLIAVGAIITFALNVAVSGVDLATVGVILMIVGGIGLVWSLLVVATSGRGRVVGPGTTVIQDSPTVDRTVVRERY